MFLGLLVLITALSISAVAIYYSVSGLVAIFAAAAIPIIIMGSVLEVGKLVTAVWLHKYWRQAKWWLKTYLSIATILLMFITSMGIFGFLSKAHIEQTASAEEGIAQISRLQEEIQRAENVIARAEQKIIDAQSSIGENNAAIQSQIDLEQQRIDSAYERIQPAIDEQNAIIADARAADANRTQPYEEQLAALDEELRRLDAQAAQYENRIAQLSVDTSAVDPLLAQISSIEESIVRVEGQLASRERDQIAAAQRTIGANADGAAGPNTRRSADAWITQQRSRIAELQGQIAELRSTAQTTVDTERTRLTNLVASIRGEQTDAIKTRQLELLATIDNVRATESPAIQAARDEIIRIRASADAQIAQSNDLIQNLRNSLTIGSDADIDNFVAEQQNLIRQTNLTIDTLTEQMYSLQAEYRKLEAEVGPVKYLAEFVYGESADQNLLEEAVRWVIILIIFVFDPLAVLLLIASQATFEMRREAKDRADKESHRQRWRDYEQKRAQAIVNNPGFVVKESNNDNTDRSNDGGDDWKGRYARTYTRSPNSDSRETSNSNHDSGENERLHGSVGTTNDRGMLPQGVLGSDSETRRIELEEKELDVSYTELKRQWKQLHPEQTVKFWKEQYILGKIDRLPWEDLEPKIEK